MVMFPSLKCVVFHRHGTFSVVCCLCTMPSDSKRLSSQIFSTLIEGGGSGRVELTGLGAHVLKCTKLWALHPTLDMVAQTWDPRRRQEDQRFKFILGYRARSEMFGSILSQK